MKHILAALVTVAIASAAQAQDADSSRWTGPYIGLQTGQWGNDSISGERVTHAVAGWNVGLGASRMIVGAELQVGEYQSSGTSYREHYLDLVVGYVPTDRVFVYAMAGIGQDDTESARNLGIGADFALTNKVSLGARTFWFESTDGSTDWRNTMLAMKYSF